MIGDRFERIIDEFAKTVEVTDPEGKKDVFRPENLDGQDRYLVVYPPSAEARVGGASDGGTPDPQKKPGETAVREERAGVDRPGLYELRLTGGSGDTVGQASSDWFAVRLDPAEGDVSKLDIEDWKEQLSGLDVRRATADSLGDAFQTAGPGQQGDELWPHVLALCVGFLALESLLAALFGRRRQ